MLHVIQVQFEPNPKNVAVQNMQGLNWAKEADLKLCHLQNLDPRDKTVGLVHPRECHFATHNTLFDIMNWVAQHPYFRVRAPYSFFFFFFLGGGGGVVLAL